MLDLSSNLNIGGYFMKYLVTTSADRIMKCLAM